MERTIQLVGDNVPRGTLQKVAEAVSALELDFPDYGARIYFLISNEGVVNCARERPGTIDSAIVMDASTFHKAACGSTNLGTALMTGKLSITGVPALSLTKFTPLLKPFLNSYLQACSEFNGSTT